MIERALAIPGLTSDDDVRWLADQARTRQVIIDIGPYRGRSTRALADASTGVVYAVDNWNASINRGRPDTVARAACFENLADLIETMKIRLYDWNSQLGIPPPMVRLEADMLWIDADHTYVGVKSDILTFAPLVLPGGLICGHDYNVHHPEVMRAVDEIYGSRVRSLGLHRSIWWVE